MTELGREVRRLREAHGWSQNQLSVYAGLSQPTVNQIETGKRNPSTATVVKLAKALGVGVSDLFPKATAPSPEPSLFNGVEDERCLRYLRGWRAFVHHLARRWEEKPPETSREISPLFDAMTALVEQGVFEPSDISAAEGHELMLLTVGFQRLNDIADKVEKDEEAQQRRATFALIQEKQEQVSA